VCDRVENFCSLTYVAEAIRGRFYHTESPFTSAKPPGLVGPHKCLLMVWGSKSDKLDQSQRLKRKTPRITFLKPSFSRTCPHVIRHSWIPDKDMEQATCLQDYNIGLYCTPEAGRHNVLAFASRNRLCDSSYPPQIYNFQGRPCRPAACRSVRGLVIGLETLGLLL